MVGLSLMFRIGIRKLSNVMFGMVCSIFVKASIFLDSLGCCVINMLVGIVIIVASKSEIKVSLMCLRICFIIFF